MLSAKLEEKVAPFCQTGIAYESPGWRRFFTTGFPPQLSANLAMPWDKCRQTGGKTQAGQATGYCPCKKGKSINGSRAISEEEDSLLLDTVARTLKDMEMDYNNNGGMLKK